MDTSLCGLCKNPFYADSNQRICLSCEQLLFDVVKEYIENHNSVDFRELINETGVSKKSIDKWLMEGRLTVKGSKMNAYVNERRKAIQTLAKGIQNSKSSTTVESEDLKQISFHTKK